LGGTASKSGAICAILIFVLSPARIEAPAWVWKPSMGRLLIFFKREDSDEKMACSSALRQKGAAHVFVGCLD
jgi:hypothetical protein